MVAKSIAEKMSGSSWIRAMFEKGAMLREKYGADKVYDFSLGNPDLEPPIGVKKALIRLAGSEEPDLHKYMNNAGFPDVRAKISAQIQRETGLPLSGKHIIMTCGAAGGLNVVLHTILNPGEEVIVLAPYFAEYLGYIENHRGKVVLSPCSTGSFEPDLSDLERKITPSTKALILNSPNNPTGVVYSSAILGKMAELIEAKEREFHTQILILSDEPYTRLVYDGCTVPSVLRIFPNSVVVNSYSKSLALPGERIGYIAAHPFMKNVDSLINGFAYSNRALGFVNAPSMFQKVIAESLEESVGTDIYRERRDLIYNHLIQLGYTCRKPQGAFYLFPRALIDDDIAFVEHAAKYNVLLVPGTGFGCPGYFRLSYSVSRKTIENSLPAFEKLTRDFQ
ncbi:MAG TPA: pyridoxal phosphate-dependent aminotransferase [Clostridiales bacterium]|nr:pyridoxal phosphate-dependent aminotransferase [Clostridiales bacterium]